MRIKVAKKNMIKLTHGEVTLLIVSRDVDDKFLKESMKDLFDDNESFLSIIECCIRKSEQVEDKYVNFIKELKIRADACNTDRQQWIRFIAARKKKEFSTSLEKCGCVEYVDFIDLLDEIFYLSAYVNIDIYKAFMLPLPYDIKTLIAEKLCEEMYWVIIRQVRKMAIKM